YGLTAGPSYAIYNQEAAIPFENQEVRQRFESKREADIGAIYSRIDQVGVERAYRIVGMLEQTAQMLKQEVVAPLQSFIERWRRKILWLEGVILTVLLAAFLTLTIWGGYWAGLTLELPFWDLVTQNNYTKYGSAALILVVAGYVHIRIRRWAAQKVSTKLLLQIKDPDLHPNYKRAFRKSSRWWRSLILPNPAGWGRRTSARLEKILDDSNAYIQKLNDEYTNPSGNATVDPAIRPSGLEETRRPVLSQDESENTLQDKPGPATMDN
ncbi:MAG: hypothetical protein KJO34_17605, partial [Deltaproteobacteria bacterium]|nr:hypothetical protein [Deltaproteobacteria bacterium]